jgi:hypothetical protein
LNTGATIAVAASTNVTRIERRNRRFGNLGFLQPLSISRPWW